MLLGDLGLGCSSRVVIESAAHEIASFAVVLAAPSVLQRSVDCLSLHQVIMALGLDEVPIPLFYLPEILIQQLIQPHFRGPIQLLEFSLLNERENRHDERRRIHLKYILIDELDLWHH